MLSSSASSNTLAQRRRSLSRSIRSSQQSRTIRRKLVFVGDGAVGKSSLLSVYATGDFPSDYVPTIFENFVTFIDIDGKEIELALWDTAGQDDYDRLRPLSYPDTDVVLLCFPVDSPDGFDNLIEKWLPELNHHCPHTPKILVGLKADLRDNYTRAIKCIRYADAEGFADRIGAVKYLECSAKTGMGVHEAIEYATRISLLPQRRRGKLYGGRKAAGSCNIL
ncbi:hypothetical protein SmJEL517_g03998 [Synchytrium microbalum]|uniref:Small monomeric GTPase n=1 Tax=Synchytrium microbalum TaxID=1806994 RepID=A0A507C1M9_9FUNG|nr:uncharacterized protein SmJEL517_g03998 [Synchytrium microbalum]TPX32969.1 hypothetical protein SmJEL517_g03998 [Synchytrium microbalum]